MTNLIICSLLLLLFVKLANSYLDCGNSTQRFINYLNNSIPINCSIEGSKEQFRCSIDHIWYNRNKSVYTPNLNPPERSDLSHLVKTGGYFKPACVPIQKVAIIIPYRSRTTHLPICVYNLHKILTLQNITEYRIVVVEQNDYNQFNRAKLFNVGFVESIKLFGHFDCFIFHDVELIPINYANLYTCSLNPRHMSYNIMGFKTFYEKLFGGINAISYRQMIEVNGFSNRFWGWGGEDDEMRTRLVRANYHIERFPFEVAMYLKLKHTKDKLNDFNANRFNLMKQSNITSRIDGINSVKYENKVVKLFDLYTLISVDLQYSLMK